MRRLKEINPAIVGLVLAGLVVLWLVRPIFHGFALFFWTAPFVWLAPLVLLAIGAVLLKRSQRNWTTLEDLRSGVRPPSWLVVFPVAALAAFMLGASLSGPLVGRAI